MSTKEELQAAANVEPKNSDREVKVLRYRILIQEISEEHWVKPEYATIGQEVVETKADGTPLETPIVKDVYGYKWETHKKDVTTNILEQLVPSIDIPKVIAAINKL
jgi:hypothetical protein